jgi:hypothetical protein
MGRYPTFMEWAARHAAIEVGRSSRRDRPPEAAVKAAEPPAHLPIGGVQRPGMLGQQRVGAVWQAERGQHVPADRLPRLAFQEPGLRVAPLRGGVGVDIPSLQVPPELLEHAEGVGVPAHRAVRVPRMAEHQPLPRAAHHFGVDQAAGDQRCRQAALVGQHVGQCPHRRQHRRALGARPEADHSRQHLQEPRHGLVPA